MKMNTILTGLLLMGAFASSAGAAPRDIILLDGKTKPRIIVFPSGTASEKYAAKELATYLQKISGQEIIAEESETVPTGASLIIVGHHPANADLQPEKMWVEESVVDVRAGRVRIVGGKEPARKLPNGEEWVQDRGTLYGVYELLDKLGVRWYRPDPWGEHVPQMREIKLTVGQHRSKPSFRYRWSISGYTYWKDDTPETGEWARLWATRNRLNTMTYTKPELGGYRAIMMRHIYSTLFPVNQYFAEHPEYYALIDGERRKNGQLCLSNPDVQRLTVEKILAFAKQNPNYESYSLEPDDHDRWCQCEGCRAMDDPNLKSIFSDMTIEWSRPLGDIESSNRVALFGKKIAEDVYKVNKDLKIMWLAYATHTESPVQITSMPPNVRVIPAAFSSAFSDPQNSYSDYSRGLYDPQSKPNQNFLRVMKGWGKLTPLLTREYWGSIAWMGPTPLITTMQDRLKAYRDLKTEGFYNEVNTQWGPQTIDHYFMTRLAWNPDLDVAKELDLFCKNYYGPAYKPMKEYHTMLEKAAHSGIPHYSYGIHTYKIFTPPIVKRMGELIAEAKGLIGDKEPYARRFHGTWAGYQYVRLVLPYHDELAKGNKLEAAKHWERGNKFVLSYKGGEVFNNGVPFSSLQFFGNYNLNIPAAIQKQAKEAVAEEALPTY
jgi:hypothetical protein